MIVHFSALRRFQYNRAWAPVMNIIAKSLVIVVTQYKETLRYYGGENPIMFM